MILGAEYTDLNGALEKLNMLSFDQSVFLSKAKITGVIQLIPPVLSSETLLHILLSSEYSGFRPSTTAVVTQPVHT